MLDVVETTPERLKTLRLFFCGGTTVSPDLIRRAGATIPEGTFYRAYGSTECLTATLGYRTPEEKFTGAETDGQVRYPVEMRIVDAHDREVAEGVEGDILMRSPGAFVGYISESDNQGAFLPDGFFRMGDLGRRVHGDYVVITGRSKDIIIRSGENISPKEVEDVLTEHPAVAEVAIVAMPSPTTGEMGCAFIIPRAGQTIDLPEIRRFLDGAGLARQKFPEHVVLVDELPRVPSGKVRKDALRVRAREIAEMSANQ
jgi:acyl-CoA synthetase (AMP-forming)/AMP-acid ligase II